MAIFILNDATGIGSDEIDTLQAFIDLVIIADDDGIGLNDPAGGMQQVTYNRTMNGPPQVRLDNLVNTVFTPDYGTGIGPQTVDVIIIPALSGFTLDDGTSFEDNGAALPPSNSGLGGASLNTTNNCLVIYDTQADICVARDGTGGDIDLPISNPVLLYHEFSHAWRIVNNTMLALTAECDPSSPEENAAISDENDLRTQIANRTGVTPELRDPDIHCGNSGGGCDAGCCVIATLVSKSWNSVEVQSLRRVRDHFVRKTEVGFAFFDQMHRDYYSFSPQVTTMMAGSPDLASHFLEGYINPLLDFWKIMIKRSQNNVSPVDIGEAFLEFHLDKAKAQQRYESLQRTAMYWLRYDPDDGEVPAELIKLLQERAWTSEYIQWALIQPVRGYFELLRIYLDGGDAKAIRTVFEGFLENWLPEMPIASFWGMLSSSDITKEMSFIDQILLQSDIIKKRYCVRLKERFSNVTAVANVVKGVIES